jgi:hypothetical protein
MSTGSALVSLCNSGEQPGGRISGLVVVDFTQRKPALLEVTHPDIRPHFGISGLARWRDGHLVVVQSRVTQVVELDADFEVRQVVDVPTATDPHSILPVDGLWLVTSTASDSVVAVDPGDGRASTVWQLPSSGGDTIHVNSLFVLDGHLCVTAFGHRVGRWRAAKDGQVIDLVRGSKLLGPLAQPHSGQVVDGDVVLCESARSRLVSTSGETLDVPLGYVRGLDVSDTHAVVGTSRGRYQAAGYTTVQLWERTAPGLSGLRRCRVVDLGHLSGEVYDTLLL